MLGWTFPRLSDRPPSRMSNMTRPALTGRKMFLSYVINTCSNKCALWTRTYLEESIWLKSGQEMSFKEIEGMVMLKSLWLMNDIRERDPSSELSSIFLTDEHGCTSSSGAFVLPRD